MVAPRSRFGRTRCVCLGIVLAATGAWQRLSAEGGRYPLREALDRYQQPPIYRLPPIDEAQSIGPRGSAVSPLPLPLSAPRVAWQVDEPPEDPDTAPADADAPADSPKVDDKPLGDAPVGNSEIFLRQSTVLLKPGEGQYDIGVAYVWQETQLPVQLLSGDLANEQLRARELSTPLNVRYGIMEGTEIFGQLPVGVALLERSNPSEDTITTRPGIGDLTIGVKSLRCKETDSTPDVILLASVTAPIGSHPYHAGDAAAMGGGFWSLFGGVNLVKSYDPVVVFGGVGYSHYFEENFAIGAIQPGEQFDYSFGMGMAVNEDVVLSAEFLGSLQTYAYVDDVRVPNSLVEPMSLRFGLTQVMARNRYVEPFVIFGLTSDAPTVQIGVLWTGGFGCSPAAGNKLSEADAKE